MFTLALSLPFAQQPYPLLSWVLAIAAVIIVGIAKSGFGAGVGVVAVPLFVFAFGDPGPAMGALLPLLVLADTLSVYHHFGTWDRRNLKVLAPGTVVGILLGVGLIYYLMGMPHLGWMPASWDFATGHDMRHETERQFEFVIGIICVLYVLADQFKARLAPHKHLQAGYVGGSIAGVTAGVTSTVAHAAGPVITIYLLGQHQPKQKFIGTCVIYFFTMNVLKLIPYALLGLIAPDTLWPGLWLLPVVPVGTFLGVRLNRVMSDRAFRITILVITAVSGVQMMTGLDPVKLIRMW